MAEQAVIDPALQGLIAAATFVLSLKLTGEHTAETPWWRKAAGIGYGAFGLWLALMLLSSAVPVVRDMRAPVAERGPGHVVLSITADRRRANECKFQYAEAYLIYANTHRPMRRAGLEVLDDPAPGESRPAGPQWFGNWRIKFDANQPPASVLIVAHHDCGMLGGDVTTTSGPFAVGAI